MPMVTIVVQGTEAPKPGKQRGRIKSDTGMLFQATPAQIGQVRMGGTYEVAYKDESFGDAKYRVVEGIFMPGENGRAPPPPPVPQRVGPQTPASYRSAPMPENSKDMHIFVCGAYNNALSNPTIDPFGLTTSDKLKFITEQMEIYKLTLGRKPEDKIETSYQRQSFKDELNDEIPGF